MDKFLDGGLKMSIVDAQKKVKANIAVRGFEDWHQCVSPNVNFLGRIMSIDDYLDCLVRINNNHTFERGIVGHLIVNGFTLEELEIETTCHEEWGLMVWYKDHPKYLTPREGIEITHFAKTPLNFLRAMFRTQTAGDQEFCLLSTAVNACGFHKTIIYHKAIFSKTK